jgi:hypothetical protein
MEFSLPGSLPRVPVGDVCVPRGEDRLRLRDRAWSGAARPEADVDEGDVIAFGARRAASRAA